MAAVLIEQSIEPLQTVGGVSGIWYVVVTILSENTHDQIIYQDGKES